MFSITHLFENSRRAGKTTLAMIQHFETRTNYHISLVQKYIDKIIALKNPILYSALLEKEKEHHDLSKFKEPEYTPYLHITWKGYMKSLGAEYIPSSIIQKQMNEATFHHIKNNPHHPEYWYGNLRHNNLNSTDRDKPPEKIVDATRMPPTYVALMVADWLAMSEELNTDPREWAFNNINKRWKFTKEQEDLIYNLIDELWKE